MPHEGNKLGSQKGSSTERCIAMGQGKLPEVPGEIKANGSVARNFNSLFLRSYAPDQVGGQTKQKGVSVDAARPVLGLKRR